MSGKFKNVTINRDIKTHKDMQKAKGGRPKLEDKQKKKEKVFVSFTTEEKSKLLQHANQNGMPLATYIRKVLKESGAI